jgi:hypothetical protein
MMWFEEWLEWRRWLIPSWHVVLESAKDQILEVDTPGQHVLPCVRYETACDEDINTSATIIPSIEILGPITRSRAQQLNHQVNSFLCSSAYNIESQLLPNDLIILSNQGENHGG